MCGIVAILSRVNIVNKIIDKLKLLEYRGYDSAGIGYLDDKTITLIKSVGRVKQLQDKVGDIESNCVIAHTRWATHGKPTLDNCHPHKSCNGNWAVVHNGIITNIDALKEYIGDYDYKSDTDTEVISALLYKCNPLTSREFCQCLSMLEGTYAIVCICALHPNSLFVTKKFSPLYVGVGVDTIVASDTVCFEDGVYYTLEDNEVAVIEQDNIKFFSSRGYRIKKRSTIIHQNTYNSVDNMEHSMLSEIKESTVALSRIIDNAKLFYINFWKYSKIYFVGCGSAYNSMLLAKYYLSEYDISIECDRASEFVCTKHYFKDSLCVFVSQSGETADTILACKCAIEGGADTLAITNNDNSYLSRLCNNSMPIIAGREVAVASTKAYTCQIAIMKMLAENLSISSSDKWQKVLRAIDEIDIKAIMSLSQDLVGVSRAFFLGRGLDYLVSIEASLKLKEVSYINCSAYPSGELKHGPLALIEDGDIVIICTTQSSLLDKTNNIIHEVKSRGGRVIVFSQYKFDIADKYIKLPQVDDELMPIVATVAFQYFAYYVSVNKGINPDRPRNLAKSVTVE